MKKLVADDINIWLSNYGYDELMNNHSCNSASIHNQISHAKDVLLDLFYTNFDFKHSFSYCSDILNFSKGVKIENKKNDKLAIFIATNNRGDFSNLFISLHLSPSPYFDSFVIELDYNTKALSATNLFGPNLTIEINIPLVKELLVSIANKVIDFNSSEITVELLSSFSAMFQKRADI